MDVEYVAKCAAGGDRGALSTLCEAFYPQLYRFFVRLTRGTQDADDLAQTTLLTMMEKLRTYRGLEGTHFKGWLFKIAYNKFIDHTRGKQPEALTEYDPPGDFPGLLEELIRDERKAALHHALAQLDDEMRAMVVMRYEFDMSYPEIAKALKINVVRVKWRLHDALKKLKDLLVKEGLT